MTSGHPGNYTTLTDVTSCPSCSRVLPDKMCSIVSSDERPKVCYTTVL